VSSTTSTLLALAKTVTRLVVTTYYYQAVETAARELGISVTDPGCDSSGQLTRISFRLRSTLGLFVCLSVGRFAKLSSLSNIRRGSNWC
jgi:hypothetical protein